MMKREFGQDQEPEDGLAVIEILHSSDRAGTEFKKWIELRQEYVKNAGWDVETEGDSYDDDPRTLHLVAYHPHTNEIIAGMRLTPMQGVDSCMSWSMISHEMRQKAFEENDLKSLETQNMWDLTRLISSDANGDRETQKLQLEAVYALLGAGLETTRSDDGAAPRWFFTTTQSFLQTSSRMGITFHELVSGIIPNPKMGEREPVTAFCYADPQYETDALAVSTERLHTVTFAAVTRGIGAFASTHADEAA